MSFPGGPTSWWESHVWDRDDAAMGLPSGYQPVVRSLLKPWCWLGVIEHLNGPCGICARGCGYIRPDPAAVGAVRTQPTEPVVRAFGVELLADCGSGYEDGDGPCYWDEAPGESSCFRHNLVRAVENRERPVELEAQA